VRDYSQNNNDVKFVYSNNLFEPFTTTSRGIFS